MPPRGERVVSATLNPDDPLDGVVVGLEITVPERPVDQDRAGDVAEAGARHEVHLAHARREHRRPAGAPANQRGQVVDRAYVAAGPGGIRASEGPRLGERGPPPPAPPGSPWLLSPEVRIAVAPPR